MTNWGRGKLMKLGVLKATFAACSLLSCILLILVLFDKSAVNQILGSANDFVATLLHDLVVGGIILFWGCIAIGGMYILIRLRREHRYHVIRPSKEGHKAQAIIDADGQIVHRLDFDLEILTNITGLMRGMAPTNIYQQQLEGPEELLALPPGNVPQIRLSEALGKLTRNAMQVYWGRKEDGGDCIKTLEEATHTQKSGMTKMGKSYLTMCELYCLHAKNEPSYVQFAYIDLEGETTEPYWDAPHTWLIKGEISAIAHDLDSVLPLLVALDTELTYRDQHKHEIEKFPYILIVVEEAEELLDALEELPKDQYKEAIRLLKRFARRGRKRKILLDINVQNTYTNLIFRAAQRQFQLKITAAQLPTTARAGGFEDLELLKRLYMLKKRGLFVVNHEEGEFMMQAPMIDVDPLDFSSHTIEARIESEVEQEYRNPSQDDDELRFPIVDQKAETLETMRHFAHTTSISEVMSRQNHRTVRLQSQPLERVPMGSENSEATSGETSEKFQFSSREKMAVINLYKKYGTIDAVLQTFGRGARWQASASQILKDAGLIER
jgi:hypothetical protein